VVILVSWKVAGRSADRHDWRRDDRLSDHSAPVAELRIENPTSR
jgi:hypothetical protein